MRKIALAFAFVACVVHGRRVHAPMEQSSQRATELGSLARFLVGMNAASAFNPSNLAQGSSWSGSSPISRSRTEVMLRDGVSEQLLSRRAALLTAAGLLGVAAFPPRAALAVSDPKDFSRIKKGIEEIQYLLDNFEVETTDPKTGNQTPDKLRSVCGLRSTESTLYGMDKMFKIIEKKLPEDVDFDKWVEVKEAYNEAVNKVNELAYTSSFGEYNPGGGKDQVRKYLELAKGAVIEAQGQLKKMVKLLNL
mmetsp:Transcript_44024/g.81827  ORF Transcript_44024/g.81827 Transcript_44024/m.81827 type:complete len:250 (-) Transcript_44024:303-1052(-)